MIFTYIKAFLLNLLFPIFCVGCKKDSSHFCRECFAKIVQQISSKRSRLPHANALDEVISTCNFIHNSPLAELIHRFKYDGAIEIASLLAGLFQEGIEGILVPVPLHKRRYRFRGFNQSSLLAKILSERFKLPLHDILKRDRYTEPQVELDGAKRLTNVRDAFSLKKGFSINSKITYVLVDDVCTTGATLNECAKVLKAKGATKVVGLVVAKAI